MSDIAKAHELIRGKTGLLSEECICGGRKDKMKTVCFTCYRALPKDVGKALYARIGSGYEKAFENAVEELRKAGRVK